MNELSSIKKLKQGLWYTIWSLDRLRKNIIATVKNEVSNITSARNLAETVFLDGTFNLPSGKYYRYNKTINIPL